VSLLNSQNDLPKKRPRLRLSQPPPRPDVGVEVGETRREEEVGLPVADDNLVDGVDVGVAVNPEVGRQHAASDRVVVDDLGANLVEVIRTGGGEVAAIS
jgi:hypothetical protein